MRLSKKLALAGIFSLVIITITFATIRAIASTTSTGMRDPSWRYLWTVIEALVGKKTNNLPHLFQRSCFFRVGLIKKKKKKKKNNSVDQIMCRLFT